MSRIGRMSIAVSEQIKLDLQGSLVVVEGPKGKLQYELPNGISLQKQENEIRLEVDQARAKKLKAFHGTARSLVANMIKGVTEGFEKNLELHGVGFRATVKGKDLDLSLGKSHPILHPIPEEVKVKVEENTKIKVSGINKQKVGQFSAEVRSYYPPEPYKGKGVRYSGERIRRKSGKSVSK